MNGDLVVIAQKLLSARVGSRGAFVRDASELSGRYILIDEDGQRSWIQSDAFALRSVYYHGPTRLIASHQNLVNELAGGLPPSEFGAPAWKQANPGAVNYPGWNTHFEGIRFLNANSELEVSTMVRRRVELSPPEDLSTAEVATRVLDRLRSQVPHMARMADPVVSLTAGQDSRTTLSVLRSRRNDFRYFTYALNYSRRLDKVHEDVLTSQRVAQAASLHSHTVLEVNGPVQSKSLREVFARNSAKRSNPNVAETYKSELGGGIHLRSSCNEVGTSRYRKLFPRSHGDAETQAMVLAMSRVDVSDSTIEAMQEYITETGMLDVSGYHPLDLHYWEIRMGNWLGTILQESDIVFDTHILINSRETVRLLLSAPLGERQLGATWDAVVGLAWPELYSVPVNGVLRHIA